jgi:hypothetical protein
MGEVGSIVLAGRITAYTAAPIWQSAIDTLARNPDRPVVVDASRLEYVDDVGIAAAKPADLRDHSPDPRVRQFFNRRPDAARQEAS